MNNYDTLDKQQQNKKYRIIRYEQNTRNAITIIIIQGGH